MGICHSQVFRREASHQVFSSFCEIYLGLGSIFFFFYISNLLLLRFYFGWSDDKQEVSKERMKGSYFSGLLLNDVQKKPV